MLELRDLSLTYAGRTVLASLSAHLQGGQVTAVLGPNGAGKSSLLRLASGEQPPGAQVGGEVLFRGRNLAGIDLAIKARGMAVLPQQSHLDFAFRAREVVMLGRTPHRTGLAADREVVADALAAVDAAHLADRPYPQLSGGEQQRVQLARVLAQAWHAESEEGALLILDEPTSALDLAHQQQVLALLRRRAGAGDAVLLALHDLNLAGSYADQILLLAQGRLCALGSPEEVLREDLLQEVFGLPFHRVAHPARDGSWLVY